MSLHRRRFVDILVSIVGSAAVVGCSGSRPLAAAATKSVTADDARYKAVLTKREQAEAVDAMRSIAPGYEPVHGFVVTGPRWEDMPPAVDRACREVDAVVLERIFSEDDEVQRYRLTTLEDWPGELTVERRDGAQIYVAKATFGRFPDRTACRERAARLLEALRESLEAIGARPRYAGDVESRDR